MKRKGFTLVELLGVIILLALIVLIITPIVMDTIETSKVGAAERSIDNYVNALETTIMEAKVKKISVEDGTYSLEELQEIIGEVKVNGTKPEGGNIVIEAGTVKDTSSFKIDKYIVSIEEGTGIGRDFGTVIEGNDIKGQDATKPTVLYNPVKNKKCNILAGDCKGWYVLEDGGEYDVYVTLIMSQNLTGATTWCASGNNNSCDADKALEKLKEETSGWAVVKVDLPTFEQMKSTGCSTNYDSCKKWLYINSGAGYWLKDAFTLKDRPDLVNLAYVMQPAEVRIGNAYVNNGNYAVRPVITILKSSLN